MNRKEENSYDFCPNYVQDSTSDLILHRVSGLQKRRGQKVQMV